MTNTKHTSGEIRSESQIYAEDLFKHVTCFSTEEDKEIAMHMVKRAYRDGHCECWYKMQLAIASSRKGAI